MLVLIMGCIGLTLNIISALFLHGKSKVMDGPTTQKLIHNRT